MGAHDTVAYNLVRSDRTWRGDFNRWHLQYFFGQIYIVPGISFPFSTDFQLRLSREVTDLVEPSSKFIKKYGSDFKLIFRISAKTRLQDNEIKGPSVYRKDKDVEYVVFLPFDVIATHDDAPKHALRFLLKGVCEVFDLLEIEADRLVDKRDMLIEGMCSDQSMLKPRSWDEESNPTRTGESLRCFSTRAPATFRPELC